MCIGMRIALVKYPDPYERINIFVHFTLLLSMLHAMNSKELMKWLKARGL